MFFAEKIQNIYMNLSLLLPCFKRICVSRLVDLPRQIDTAAIGENKLRLFTNGTIQEVNTSDLSGVTRICDRMFYNCSSLISVSMPDSIINIGNYAFTGCTNLTDIYLNPVIPPTLENTNAIPSTTTIHVPIDSGDTYRNTTNWSSFASQIVEDIVI